MNDVLPELEAEPDIHLVVEDELTSFTEATEAPVIDVTLRDGADGHTDWSRLGRVPVTNR